MDPADLANAVVAAVNQIMAAQAAAVPQGAGGAAAAAGPVPFALSPALAHPDIIDYSTSSGAKIFTSATVQLPTTFNLEEPNIRVLINELQTRAASFGWEELLTINVAEDLLPETRKSLLTEHGQCTLEAVRRDSTRYIITDTRKTQNNYQLFVCLTNSIDEKTKKTLANEESSYLVMNKTCGVTYLKLLLQKAEVDTRATASHIRKNLTQLDIYMESEAKHDIRKFNQYVKDQLHTLSSRGETSSDILTNLFTGYQACTDKKFVEYIDKYKDEYEEGEDITYETLMAKAEKKYQARLLSSEWNAPTREQEEIIALKSQIADLRVKRKANPTAPKKEGKDERLKGKKPKKEQGGKRTFRGRWQWREVPPRAGEPATKSVDGEDWHYCAHHGYWVKHTTEECDMARRGRGTQAGGNPSAATDEISAAMASVGINDIDEEASDDEG